MYETRLLTRRRRETFLPERRIPFTIPAATSTLEITDTIEDAAREFLSRVLPSKPPGASQATDDTSPVPRGSVEPGACTES